MSQYIPTFELVLSGGSDPRVFTACAPGEEENGAVENSFEWRFDSTALNLDLGELARAAVAGEPPKNDVHIQVGRRLYEAVFSGPVGVLWQERRKQVGRKRIRLALRIDPQTARPLLNLPWEFLHDGQEFLVLNRHIAFSRLPADISPEPFEKLDEPLRLLVIIAAPHGLDENQVLNTALEEEIIMSATAPARRLGLLQVEFTPNGVPETLARYLREYDPHLLHFVGHGSFVEAYDSGVLFMEAEDGNRVEVSNVRFAEILMDYSDSLRFVFLSACQSAKVSRNSAYADLGPRLLSAGFPAVVAMQFSVFNRSAITFGGEFYRTAVEGKPVDEAMAQARLALQQSSPNGVDFATPVLYLVDPLCLQVDVEAARQKARADIPRDLSGVTVASRFVGRSAELRELQTKLDPGQGQWRAAVIHGLGGMGKTVLAARLAERMGSRLEGVKTIRLSPSSTAQDILDGLGAFLLIHNARFNLPVISQFHQIKDQPLPLEAKAGLLAEILKQLRLLIVFDNCEDILPHGQPVSKAAQLRGGEAQTAAGIDPELPKLLSLLVGSVPGPSRFLFTSRVDFDPVEAGRLAGEIGHRDLGEMGFRDAVYLMETLPPLDRLPVVILPDDGGSVQGVSMRDVYERLGGHPYTLGLFARHAARSSVGAVLEDLRGVRKELLEFTLLEGAVEKLSERAGQLLKRGAIYAEPVSVEGLAYLLGDEQDCMPEVGSEVEELLRWGLLARTPVTEEYAFHQLVKDWALEQMGEEERRELLLRAAYYWIAVGRESRSLNPELNAWHYLQEAGEWERAYEVLDEITEYLLRFGQNELLLKLLGTSLNTLQGHTLAVAQHTLAVVLEGLGAYSQARKLTEQSLATFQKLGDRVGVSKSLHQLGILSLDQGEYIQAQDYTGQALTIFRELNDLSGVAKSKHQLGMLFQAQGEYTLALSHFKQALEIFQALNDRVGAAGSLHQLGMIYQAQGEYSRARDSYKESMKIDQELGDKAGLATSLHQLGLLHQLQRDYSQAQRLYEQSHMIFQELGDRMGLAGVFHQFGMLHQEQGEYNKAWECYKQSLATAQELGNKAGIAKSFHQMGRLYQDQGEYSQARSYFEKSLSILKEIGDRAGIAKSLHQLGMLHYIQGEFTQAFDHYKQSLQIKEELGDRLGVASSLHQLGMLYQDQAEYLQARLSYKQALNIFHELGDRAGVARSLSQIGLLNEQEGQLDRAVGRLVQALAIFKQLGMPQREQVRSDLERLREKMGEEAFAAAVDGVQGSTASDGQSHADGMSQDELLRVVVNNTAKVLTTMPEKKAEWWETLGKLESELKSREQAQLASYMGLLQRLVEGADPELLTREIPEDFKYDWQALRLAIGRDRR